MSKSIQITDSWLRYEKENLIRPFGFKGGYINELWQNVCSLKASNGAQSLGLATQSVLYGDPKIFTRYGEKESNELMLKVTRRAMELITNQTWADPIECLNTIYPQLYLDSCKITDEPDLHHNFVHNALVSVDHACWLLYAFTHNLSDFMPMIPKAYHATLGERHKKIAIMYQVPYGMPLSEIERAVKKGYFIIKIKLGQAGSEDEMLQKDLKRISEIHQLLKEKHTQHAQIWYTLDANGRYQHKGSIERIIKFLHQIKAHERVLFFEEPLNENNKESVNDLDLNMAADESLHNLLSAKQRIAQGYSTFVLKSVAKTLSLTLQIAKLAYDNHIKCACADLTVNPVLMSWHQNLAARLQSFPGLEGMGLMETNGDMNYKRWSQMLSYHPCYNASWLQHTEGLFYLTDDFYSKSGGIFFTPHHYHQLLSKV